MQRIIHWLESTGKFLHQQTAETSVAQTTNLSSVLHFGSVPSQLPSYRHHVPNALGYQLNLIHCHQYCERHSVASRLNSANYRRHSQPIPQKAVPFDPSAATNERFWQGNSVGRANVIHHQHFRICRVLNLQAALHARSLPRRNAHIRRKRGRVLATSSMLQKFLQEVLGTASIGFLDLIPIHRNPEHYQDQDSRNMFGAIVVTKTTSLEVALQVLDAGGAKSTNLKMFASQASRILKRVIVAAPITSKVL